MSQRQFFWLMTTVWFAYALTIVTGAAYVWAQVRGAL
jgi:hypothetical protein